MNASITNNHSTSTHPSHYSNANENVDGLLTLQNPVFSCFVFWSSILIIKMLLMTLLTAAQRFRHKTFPNQEDLFFKDIEVQFNDPHVERVRRAHRNDLENILPFFIMALIYICTAPQPKIAQNLFRIFAITRIMHTLVYAFYPVPQPSRIIAFFIGYGITMYMACLIALRTLNNI